MIQDLNLLLFSKFHWNGIMIVIFAGLTLSQTTNFRLFQTERVCRRQFQIGRKWQQVIQISRKHCGKRRNCSLWAIYPFPSVFKRLVSQGRQKVALCGNGLNNKLNCWACMNGLYVWCLMPLQHKCFSCNAVPSAPMCCFF